LTSAHAPLPIDTLFLDAGGVLCHPSWARISAALAEQGLTVSAEALARAEPQAKRELDDAHVVRGTNDSRRGWLYFNRVLELAGIAPCDAADRALRLMQEYHGTHNLWEHMPEDVKPALERLRALGLTLVVVSNANGRLRRLFDRVGLTPYFHVVLDSYEWGVEKPDARLFHIALEHAGASASTTAHVGDLFHIDVAGARAAGLREGILLDPADLYLDVDCRRIRDLHELVTIIQPPRASA
jgi:putative hydrolase of the HAD superfamily